MGYEIDFMPVEAGEKSGDAIAFRIFDNQSSWIFAVDGGYTDSGDALVQHITGFLKGLPGATISPTSRADVHHGMLRFTWRIVGTHPSFLCRSAAVSEKGGGRRQLVCNLRIAGGGDSQCSS